MIAELDTIPHDAALKLQLVGRYGDKDTLFVIIGPGYLVCKDSMLFMGKIGETGFVPVEAYHLDVTGHAPRHEHRMVPLTPLFGDSSPDGQPLRCAQAIVQTQEGAKLGGFYKPFEAEQESYAELTQLRSIGGMESVWFELTERQLTAYWSPAV